VKEKTSIPTSWDVLRDYLQNLHFKEEIIRETLDCFKEKRYEKGEFFSHAGHVDGQLGFVVHGLFHMFIENEAGTLFTKDFLYDGQFLLAAFDPQQDSLANIRAIKDSIILEANYADIWKLFSKYPEFEHAAKQGAEKRMQAIYARMESFPLMEAKERYEQFLATFADIEVAIPQYLVASYLGITPTQLSRIRKGIKYKQ
jgi:CRP-like cAMP-binding protein